MAAFPSRIGISPALSKEIVRPVGNSPGPDSIVNVTAGELLSGLPAASSTVTRIVESSVASVPSIVALSEVRLNCAGTPDSGHVGGGICRSVFRYQYHDRLGIRA